jgi:Na+(H+)/acetate symporter ActP
MSPTARPWKKTEQTTDPNAYYKNSPTHPQVTMLYTQAEMFKHPTFANVVRENLALQLVATQSWDITDAREAAYGLDTDTIADAATAAAGTSAPAPGTLLAMILAFISSPAFAQLLATLIGLFGGAAAAANSAKASGS